MNRIAFSNPEAITEEEVLSLLKKYPIDYTRVKDFLIKEPGIKEAFLNYSSQYVNDFSNSVGIEFKPAVYSRLQEIFLTCLAAGYLTRMNLFNSKFDKSMKEGEKKNGIDAPN